MWVMLTLLPMFRSLIYYLGGVVFEGGGILEHYPYALANGATYSRGTSSIGTSGFTYASLLYDLFIDTATHSTIYIQNRWGTYSE